MTTKKKIPQDHECVSKNESKAILPFPSEDIFPVSQCGNRLFPYTSDFNPELQLGSQKFHLIKSTEELEQNFHNSELCLQPQLIHHFFLPVSGCHSIPYGAAVVFHVLCSAQPCVDMCGVRAGRWDSALILQPQCRGPAAADLPEQCSQCQKVSCWEKLMRPHTSLVSLFRFVLHTKYTFLQFVSFFFFLQQSQALLPFLFFFWEAFLQICPKQPFPLRKAFTELIAVYQTHYQWQREVPNLEDFISFSY